MTCPSAAIHASRPEARAQRGPEKPNAGTLPPEWGTLPSLQQLSLHGNRLSSNIPWTGASAFPSTPDSIHLSGNNLTGPLPPEFSNATGLWLEGNQLTGALPAAFGPASRLTWLIAPGNRFSGGVPALGSSLVQLDLSFNLLGGQLPDVGGASTWGINLEGNPGISGTLPPVGGLPTLLVTLSLPRAHRTAMAVRLPASSGGPASRARAQH
jgi:hypothetical protein